MANVIKLKRGTSTPTTSDIVDGEVAIDKSAKKLYLNDGGTVKEIGGGGGLTSDAQFNTVGGTNAGDSFTGTDANTNTLIGYNAGTAITSADSVTAIGAQAGESITTNGFQTLIGFKAGQSNTAFSIVAVGSESLKDNTSGTHNTAVGFESLRTCTSGSSNSASGRQALRNLTTASFCTAHGFEAGKSITTSDNNTLIGASCGAAITTTSTVATGVGFEALKTATGHNLTAFGRRALYSHTASSENDGSNSAFGSLSQYLNVSGGKNSSFGNNSLQNLTTGDENTCVGMQAGQNTTTGSRNTFIGKGAGNGGGGATGDNNICIGCEVDPVFGESNTIQIGDSNIVKLAVQGLNFEILPNAITNGGAFYENAKTVAADYTLSGSNAMAAGPITINSSVTVTVSSGDTLTIV